MTNPAHLQQLSEGPDAWNRTRLSHDFTPDLSGADLRNADLPQADLRGSDLSGANLRAAYLYGANLSGANLQNADLSEAYLAYAVLAGSHLQGASLSRATLTGVNLTGLDLSQTDLTGANLTGAEPAELMLRVMADRPESGKAQPDYSAHITIDPAVRFGKPCIRGTRMTVADVLEYLAYGMTAQEITEDFPGITHQDILACFAFAAARERRMIIVAPQPPTQKPP